MRVLVINSGSSSLKYQVRDTDTNEVASSGLIDRIGEGAGGPADHGEAMDQVAAVLEDELAQRPLDAVGHRVVHGGERFSEPVRINNEITRAIERLNPLAPLHNPANVLGIRAITAKWPDLPQVAVFDTAFHRTLPEHAWRFTLLEGLVMGTRSGDVDPSILVFLQRQGMSADEIDTLLNRESGLKALFGDNDMRAIVDAAAAGDARARLALDIASYRLAKYIGGYHVAVGGAHALVFTAGIGENSADFRALVASRLGALGVKLDGAANLVRSGEPRVISAPESVIPVLVVPTDEEQAIAEATAAVVGQA